MARRMIWAVEKARGIPQKRAVCSQCGWVSEVRGIRGSIYQKQDRRGIPGNTGAIRPEFLNHDCEEFPAGIRKWKAKPQ